MQIESELARLMDNWARWRCGSKTGVATSSAYDLEARGLRAEASIPLLNPDAEEIDEAVRALRPVHRAVVIEYWIMSEPVPKKAMRCGCSERTFWRRLDIAHHEINVRRSENHRRQQALSRARREALSAA